MSGWISKAVNVFRRDSPETPQVFEVDCECERRHQGIRRTRHQHLVCKDCGASLFVLPRDEYPPPHPVAKPEPSPAVAARNLEFQREPGEPGSDDPTEVSPQLTTPGGGKKAGKVENPSPKRPDPASELPARRLTKKERKQEQERREQEQAAAEAARKLAERGPSLRQRTGKAIRAAGAKGRRAWSAYWTPFRGTATVFLIVVLGTLAWNIRLDLLRRAADTVKEGAAAGMEAIQQRNWIEARRLLEPVVVALDRLRRTDEEAENLRRYFRETEALTRLSHASLFELIEAADVEVEKSDPDRWRELFAGRYQGGWLVIEGILAPVSRKGDGEKAVTAYVMTIPWSPGGKGRSITVEADFPILKQLPKSEEPPTLIFAGQLSGCRLDQLRDEWVVTLDPKSGFLWTHLDTWESLGFGEEAEVFDPRARGILEAQSEWSGAAP